MQSKGFSLIELLVVVVLTAVMASLAASRYTGSIRNTRTVGTRAIASALSSANLNNYAARKVNPTFGIPVSDCIDIVDAMQSGIPPGYSINHGTVTVDTTVNCSLNGPGGSFNTFQATGIG